MDKQADFVKRVEEESFQDDDLERLRSASQKASSAEITSCIAMEEMKGIATDIMVEENNPPASIQCKIESPLLEDLDSFNLIEPPPLDWRSDSSSEACSLGGTDEPGSFHNNSMDAPLEELSYNEASNISCSPTDVEELLSPEIDKKELEKILEEKRKEKPQEDNKQHDMDHSHIQTLLTQLQLFQITPAAIETNQVPKPIQSHHEPLTNSYWSPSAANEVGAYQTCPESGIASGLLFTESHQRDLLELLEGPEHKEPHIGHTPQSTDGHIEHLSRLTDLLESPEHKKSQNVYTPQLTDGHTEFRSRLIPPNSKFPQGCEADEMVTVSYGQDSWHRHLQDEFMMSRYSEDEALERWQESKSPSTDELVSCSSEVDLDVEPQTSYKDVPGPCEPEDLLDGVIFGAKYLGSTQLQSERNPSTNARMTQAQEAVDRIKDPDGESQPMTDVDLFISTQRIKVLSADTQEAMMDHPLQMISYIADIGSVVVLMVRRKSPGHKPMDDAASYSQPKKHWMICHVFTSDDAQIIAQAIGQAFGVAYQQFLQANGIKQSDLRPGEYSDYLGTQELYNGDLVHFSRSENIREVCISKQVGEILGLAVVESGWGSILPTVVVANLLHGGPAERSGELSIGDRIMSVNGTSLVGLPITASHNIIRDLKNQSQVKLSIVHCPPVTMAIIKRPDPKYQLGFSVEDGIICSLMRGGIAERGGIRVGHRIIEINGQSVVATPHEKIIHILTNAVGEIHLKTMPTSTYRLLTGQDQPVFL